MGAWRSRTPTRPPTSSRMVVGQHQLNGLLGLPSELCDERIERLAREAARRFLRAYAV